MVMNSDMPENPQGLLEQLDRILIEERGSATAKPAPGQAGHGQQLERLAYSVQEAAEILGVSEKTIRRLIVRGLIKPSRALRHLLIPRKELERFLSNT